MSNVALNGFEGFGTVAKTLDWLRVASGPVGRSGSVSRVDWLRMASNHSQGIRISAGGSTMLIVPFCAGACVLDVEHAILFPLELAMGGWVGSFSKEEPPTSAGKRSSRCSRRDHIGNCACPPRGLQLYSNDFKWV